MNRLKSLGLQVDQYQSLLKEYRVPTDRFIHEKVNTNARDPIPYNLPEKGQLTGTILHVVIAHSPVPHTTVPRLSSHSKSSPERSQDGGVGG